MRRSLTAHRVTSKCAGISGTPERAGIPGTRRRCSFVPAGTPVVSCSNLPGEFLRNRSFLRQQAGVAKRLYMVKLYSNGGRLAVLSSRSNRGFGNQGSAYGLRSAASGPRASAGAGCANEANSRREYPTIPLIYHSTIPVPPVPSGAGPRGRGTRGIVRNIPSSSISDWGLRIGNRPGAGRHPCGLPPLACAGRSYKQTQFTEPIVRNKAKLGQDGASGGRRISRADCAKQTQLGPAWAGPGPRWAKDAKRIQIPAHRISRHPTIPSFQYSNPPRCRAGRDSWDVGRGAIVRNKTRTTKVAELGFDPRFRADIAGRFG
jgi:hypothetical protein